MADKEIQTTVDGLRAVELYFRTIREISNGNTAFYQSQTRLNSPKLGVLSPDKYRDVCEMTSQADKLFQLEMLQTIEACRTFTERELNFGWISVYMPVRFLKNEQSAKAVAEICRKQEISTNKICFELSENLLAETDGKAAESILNMRNFGFHFMLTDFGGSYCPMMRLSNFSVDYVMLSPEVSNYIGRDERSDNAVKSIISFVNEIGSEPVADGVFNSRQAETLYSFECSYCAGSLSGKYMAERYVRRRAET
ncbi:EAL domain-containing protein [Ruminococcus flavefaciens]|uniref:EAL domain-containing protein n=1 Tax=Ruminococcus flavefaciens TaxID=1265 RepID=UPI0026EF984B|nr:EAL domain-containing protein [Ruminococcus flavefaciens]MDD7515783.1 EAL domain-containing protein [Ruminococcus flavefaciens]MDY5691068.1 EAL domain-containing protein [Ruminococcus flavefaciens]